jgi:hypothetical protein
VNEKDLKTKYLRSKNREFTVYVSTSILQQMLTQMPQISIVYKAGYIKIRFVIVYAKKYFPGTEPRFWSAGSTGHLNRRRLKVKSVCFCVSYPCLTVCEMMVLMYLLAFITLLSVTISCVAKGLWSLAKLAPCASRSSKWIS